MVDSKLIIAAAVVIVLFALVVYIARKRMDTGTDNERKRADSGSPGDVGEPDYGISLTAKATRMTTEAKVMAIAFVIAFVVAGVSIYSYVRSGSPTQVAFATEIQYVAIGGVLVAIGVWYGRRCYAREGVLDIIDEPEAGEEGEVTTRQVYFNPRDTEHDRQGKIVHEYSERRQFGLFRRPKMAGEDRGLRNHRPKTEKVKHQIPKHAVQVGPHRWQIRTKGDQIQKSPESAADIVYRPPSNLSTRDKIKHEQEMEKAMTHVGEVRSTVARKDKYIRSLEKQVENLEEEMWTKCFEIMERFAPMLRNGQSTEKVLQQVREDVSRSPRAETGENDYNHGQRQHAGAGNGNGQGGRR